MIKRKQYETKYTRAQEYSFDGEPNLPIVTVIQNSWDGEKWEKTRISYGSTSGLTSGEVVELANMLIDAAKVMNQWDLSLTA